MKRNSLFSLALSLFFVSHATAQADYSSKNHADSLSQAAMHRLLSYISSDTLDIKLTEAEKNNVNHAGEQHILIIPTNRGVGNEQNSNSSMDKWMPTVYNKEATVGSPFLLFLYVPGLVVNDLYTIVDKKDYRYNYDKMSGNLLLRRGTDSPIAVNKRQVRQFCLKTDVGGYIFTRVPAISQDEFFQVLYKGRRYSIYKLYKVKLITANQATNGYQQAGKDYDEYEDILSYYLVDETNAISYPFELTKKSIKKVFMPLYAATETYLKDHRYDDITEAYVEQFMKELNK